MQELDNISFNFILYTARTGSTLLSSMLNMHSEIISPVEEQFAYNLFEKYKGIKLWNEETISQYCDDFYLYNNGLLELQFGTREQLEATLIENKKNLNTTNAIKLTYLNFYPNKNKDQVTTVVDKQLQYHYHISDLNQFYPKSKFIILTRDPRDNVYLKQKFFLKNNRKKDIYILAKSWDFIFGLILKKIRPLEKERVLFVKYEDLVFKPEIEIKKVCDFLGLKFDESTLQFHQNISSEFDTKINKLDRKTQDHYSNSLKSLTEKINTKKVDIWKKELTSEQSDLIWSICSDTALKYGYESNGSNKISYSNYTYLNYYKVFLLKKIIFQKLYKALPIKVKYILKKVFAKRKNH